MLGKLICIAALIAEPIVIEENKRAICLLSPSLSNQRRFRLRVPRNSELTTSSHNVSLGPIERSYL